MSYEERLKMERELKSKFFSLAQENIDNILQRRKTSMSLRPLGSFVIVKPQKSDGDMEKTEGGLYVPQSTAKKEGLATVLAVGDCMEFSNGATRPLRVKPGQTVLYDTYAGVPTKVDQKEVLILREQDIYCVLEE